MAGKKQQAAQGLLRCSDFLKAVQRDDPGPVYVLAGSDPYLVGQARAAVRACVLADTDPAMALTEFDGPDASLSAVLNALRTAPMLSPRRLVVVREADPFVTANRAALETYLETPSPSGSLCLETASWNTRTNLSKRAVQIGYVVQCEADRPEALPRWLEITAKEKYGKRLNRAAAESLIEYLGPNMGELVQTLERLDLYTGDADAIEEADVDALVTRGRHEQVWALCDAVAQRRLARAMDLLDAFWTEGMAAPQIIGLLRSGVRQLVMVAALARRMNLSEAMRQARVHPAAAGRIRQSLDAFSAAHLADAYQAMVEADLEIKTTSNDRLALETLLHRLCNPEVGRAMSAVGASP